MAPDTWQDLPADRRRRQRLLRHLSSQGFSDALLAAFVSLPRHFFLPDFVRAQAYDDTPMAIGCGQTISQPSLVLRMLTCVDVQPGMAVLDVGSGSGFVCAMLARLLGVQGIVHGVEYEASLIAGCRDVLGFTADATQDAPIILHQAEAAPGWAEAAPYDRIHVGCAAQEEVSPELVEQLAVGGVMVIPVEIDEGKQQLLRLSKGGDGSLHRELIEEVLFVPLR
jgi:protein-L-isoaspartate(D-aspartate) O-methyltransferase